MNPMIAIIDDSSSGKELWLRHFGRLDLSFEPLINHEIAISFLQENACNLIIVSTPISGTDWFSTIRDIRLINGHEHTPIIYVTSKNYLQDKVKASSLGANEVLVHPLTSGEIAHVIGKYI